MQKFRDTFEARQRSFISAFSFCMTFENTLVSTTKDVRELGTTQKIMSVEIMPGFR